MNRKVVSYAYIIQLYDACNLEIKTVYLKVHLCSNGCLNPFLNLMQVLRKNCRTRIPNWLLANKHNVCLERLHTSKSPLTDCARKSSMVYYKQCSYMSKIMPIIMLVVVNYDPFQLPKNTKNAPTIYSKFGKNSLITM